MPTPDEARQALAATVFDPTLRQVMAELFAKERAAIVADRAIAELERRVAELERDLEAARARVEVLGCRLDDALGPRVYDISASAAP